MCQIGSKIDQFTLIDWKFRDCSLLYSSQWFWTRGKFLLRTQFDPMKEGNSPSKKFTLIELCFQLKSFNNINPAESTLQFKVSIYLGILRSDIYIYLPIISIKSPKDSYRSYSKKQRFIPEFLKKFVQRCFLEDLTVFTPFFLVPGIILWISTSTHPIFIRCYLRIVFPEIPPELKNLHWFLNKNLDLFLEISLQKWLWKKLLNIILKEFVKKFLEVSLE